MAIAIAFMFKPGHQIELEALILAASVRENAVGEVNLHAFVETTDTPHVSDLHRAWFRRLGVRLREIDAKGAFRDRYPQGNKILVCLSEFSEERVIFLDSDMMLLRRTDFAEITHAPVVAAGPLSGNWGPPEKWAPVYRAFGADPDAVEQWPAPKGGTQMPYFNAGMVSFDQGTGFARAWYDVARRIDDDKRIEDKRPWLDQIALPLVRYAGVPEIRLPTSRRFNRRPSRDNLDRLVLAHYTRYCFFGAGLQHRADDLLEKHLGTGLFELEQHFIANQARVQRATTGARLPFAKVYGERHTGIATVEALLDKRFEVMCPRTQADGPMALSFLRAALGGEVRRHGSVFDVNDRAFRRTGLGWRHGAPPVETVARSAFLDETLFVFLYRDPWSWLRAMHRTPLNPFLRDKKAEAFGEFLRAPFPTSLRDRVDLPEEATALDVYQAKLRAALAFQARFPDRSLFVSWEMLGGNQRRVVKRMERHLKQKFSLKLTGIKDEELTGPKGDRAYSDTDRRFVEQRLDGALWARLDQLADT